MAEQNPENTLTQQKKKLNHCSNLISDRGVIQNSE